MKPEYYIYSWQAGAFRSDELSKSLKGYSCRDTAERIAKFRFEGTRDQIRYCVALTDKEAFAEMTRQNIPEKPAIKDDTVIYMDGTAIQAYVHEAFAEMTRQNMPNTYYDTDDVERCYKCGRLFHARPGAFGSKFCSTCLEKHHKEG